MNKKDLYESKYEISGLNPSPYFQKQFNYLKKKYLNKKTLNILDLGGGTGEYSLLLQELGNQVTLFDFSEEAIKRAKKIGVKSVICDDFLAYDFKDKKYDVVFVKGFSLLNTDNIEKFLSLKRRMSLLLNNDGYIVYMGQTNLSGTWTKSGWYQLDKEIIEKYFSEYLLFPAFRYQLHLPLFLNKVMTRILIHFKKLPKSFTLVGIIK